MNCNAMFVQSITVDDEKYEKNFYQTQSGILMGQTQTLDEGNNPTFTFKGLESFSIYSIACYSEALEEFPHLELSYKRSAIKQTFVSTTAGFPLVYDDGCVELQRTSITLHVALVDSPGFYYGLALPAKSPVPTVKQIMSTGAKSEFMNPWDRDAAVLSGGIDFSLTSPTSLVRSEADCPRSGFSDFTVTNLKPLTSYSIYFVALDDEIVNDIQPAFFISNFVDFNGGDRQIISRTYRTACCGQVEPSTGFGAAAVTTRVNTVSKPLSFTLSNAPVKDKPVVVSIRLWSYELLSGADCDYSWKTSSCSAENLTPLTSALSVSTFNFDSSSTSLSKSITVNVNTRGCSVFEFKITGDPENFDSDCVRTELKTLGSNDLPPKPKLSSAQFSNSGAQLFIVFDSPTDQGLRVSSATGVIGCDAFLAITGAPTVTDAPTASCMFTSPTTVTVTLPPTASTGVGDTVALLDGKIYAWCDKKLFSNCDTWTPAPPGASVKVGLPSVTLIPVPLISGPNSISNCNDIKLDASTSVGNGGRPWATFTWTVSSTISIPVGFSDFLTAINRDVSAGDRRARVLIPNSLIESGATYYFVLSLVNFLGGKASSSTFAVQVSSSATPTVVIAGPAKFSVSRAVPLTLNSKGTPASCGDGGGESKVTIPVDNYMWTHSATLSQAECKKGPANTCNLSKKSFSFQARRLLSDADQDLRVHSHGHRYCALDESNVCYG